MTTSRFESIGSFLPSKEESLADLLGRMPFKAPFDYGKITGIQSRHVSNKSKEHYESSFVMAEQAALDCLSRSQYKASELDVVISTSITRSKEGMEQYYSPSFAAMLTRHLAQPKPFI